MAYGIRLHCWGEFACFTRPEMKVERVSYDVMTPSAARGILEAIYWKPEIRWVIDRIHVLNPIQFTSIRRNEISDKVPAGTVATAMRNGTGILGICVDDGDTRQQRATLLLKNVSYIIEAHFIIVGGDSNEAKHLDQFSRRAKAGQCFTRPYFGCREFAADFQLLEEGELPLKMDATLRGTRDLGWMLHDINFSKGREPRFFRAAMVDGIVNVPQVGTGEVRP